MNIFCLCRHIDLSGETVVPDFPTYWLNKKVGFVPNEVKSARQMDQWVNMVANLEKNGHKLIVAGSLSQDRTGAQMWFFCAASGGKSFQKR